MRGEELIRRRLELDGKGKGRTTRSDVSQSKAKSSLHLLLQYDNFKPRIRPYAYRDATTLIGDFWATVDAVLRERGVIP